jgi:exopolysaccharide production protein ExoQ
MPPSVALLLTILFIFYLFWRDSRQQPKASSAVWIPCVLILILGSRSVSQWLNPGTFQSSDDLLEGSPLDRAVFVGLIAAGWLVLWRRQIPWRELIRNNGWLALFFLYCAVSILWSDFPFVAFKRWIKGLGGLMMALILLSDHEPAKAVETLIKRCAYVLIPLSIVFIKYYPSLGRGYDDWSGAALYTGVTTNKNLLGYLLLVFGLFFVCAMLGKGARDRDSGRRRTDVVIVLMFLLMICWLFTMADSKTALIGVIVGGLTALGLGFAGVRKYLGTYVVAGILVCAALQVSVNVTGELIPSLGRNATLTGRTELWQFLLGMTVNPLIGAGFESFWLGARLNQVWAQFQFQPNQAHNGYIEIYLNLGWVGLCLLGGVLWAAYKTLRTRLTLSADPGRTTSRDVVLATFGMAFLPAYILFNVTEATVQPLNLLFLIFLIVTIEYPEVHRHPSGIVRRSRMAMRS